MILTCPSCGTQYVVKDGAIPPGGRQVRCASCKHSWHQDPEISEVSVESDVAAPPIQDTQIEPGHVAADEDESLAEASLIEPRSGPEIEERAYEEAAIEGDAEPEPVAHNQSASEGSTYAGMGVQSAAEPAEDWREPPEDEAQDDEFSPFPAADEFAPKRRSPLVALLLIVLVVAALAAAFWFLAPPEWKAQLGLGGMGASPLALVTTHMDRQRLESGQEMLNVTGRVINPTSKEQDVPPLQAQLRSKSGKLVHTWTIAPPAKSLPPGGSASFNSTEVSVPPGGDQLTISIGSPGA
jgi:predicted Zn finger-like uncharacterized protein